MTDIRLDGQTALIPLLGDPVTQVKMPLPATEEFFRLSLNAVMMPMHVYPANFVEVVTALRKIPNVVGMVITVPHKFSLAQIADEQGERSRLCGSANVLARTEQGLWKCEMLDGKGLVDGLEHDGFSVSDKRVLVVGAGGAGAAAIAELALRGAHVSVYDADPNRSGECVGRIRTGGYDVAVCDALDTRDIDLLVNATPVGMGDGRSPVLKSLLRRQMHVADMVMKPDETPLLQSARELGCPIHFGRNVMTYQLPAVVDFLRPSIELYSRSFIEAAP